MGRDVAASNMTLQSTLTQQTLIPVNTYEITNFSAGLQGIKVYKIKCHVNFDIEQSRQ